MPKPLSGLMLYPELDFFRLKLLLRYGCLVGYCCDDDDDDYEIAYFTRRLKTRDLVLSTAPKT